MGINLRREYVEAFAQKYDEYGAIRAELKEKTKTYKNVSKRMTAKQWGGKTREGDTTFHVDQNSKFVETVAVLNIDPKVLYETANKSLRAIVDQLVQIQQDYRDTVREMHSYLSTLSNTSASGFKKEVAEFDQSVQTNVKGNERCEPDFVK